MAASAAYVSVSHRSFRQQHIRCGDGLSAIKVYVPSPLGAKQNTNAFGIGEVGFQII